MTDEPPQIPPPPPPIPPPPPPGGYGGPPDAFGGPPGSWPGRPPDIPTNLVWAILATLFCCLPAGIVSIVYAAQVSTKLAIGDYRGAAESSKNAKTWAWVSFGVTIGIVMVWGIAAVVLSAGRAGN